MRSSVLIGLALSALVGETSGSGWPTYRANPGRTGYTPEELPAEVSLRWVYRPAHRPMPAWPGQPRVPFDRVNCVVSDGRTLYFGSSADCKVYALDAATGRERWTFFTGAPVRFAPALSKDRLFAVSDDGFLYCLSARDGQLLWKKRGGPSNRMVLGNERMISKWPARGGPVVVGDTVYFGAGIWPSDGIFIHALDAATGRTVWVNDTAGAIPTAQPHRGVVKSGISCQGYLVAAGDRLFVPTGRAVPAAFNRTDGTFLYYHLGRYGDNNAIAVGGAATAVVDALLFNGNIAFDAADGKRVKALGVTSSATVAADPTRVFSAYHYYGRIRAVGLDRATPLLEKDVNDRRGKRTVQSANHIWRLDTRAVSGKHVSLIVAGGTLILGGQGAVAAIDIETKKVVWTQPVEGTAPDLAVAGGRLFVSTDTGVIHCFGAGTRPSRRFLSPRRTPSQGSAASTSTPTRATGAGTGRATVIERERVTNPYGDNRLYAAAADEITGKTGVTEGYCLDLGCGQGQLAFELARRSNVRICGVEKDATKVNAARKKLDAAGLYGVRVTVHQGHPAATGYPNYFANLVVSTASIEGAHVPAAEMSRCLRPWGGVACTGKTGQMTKSVRGPLKGAGAWTHQYADAGNTTCSDDALVKGGLTMLWFGGPDQVMADRHGRPPAPLFANGRLYVQGLNDIRAIDAYNGRVIWHLPLKGIGAVYASSARTMTGVVATGGNMCLGEKTLYVRTGDRCLRIDGATGKRLGEFATPPESAGRRGTRSTGWRTGAGDAALGEILLLKSAPPARPCASTWGAVAYENGILFGSVVRQRRALSPAEALSESKAVFALDAKTGRPKWLFPAKGSIRHNAIAIGGGMVYLIDGPRFGPPEGPEPPRQSEATLLALDADTGRVRWKRTENIHGTVLSLSTEHDVLLMSSLGPGPGGAARLAGFRASDGTPLYDVKAAYRGHSLLIGRAIHAQGTAWNRSGAWDLLTGRQLPKRTRGGGSCGIMAAGRHILTFRAATLGYVDPLRGRGVENYGGVRPGCWINAIPAGGLVLMPDYTDDCRCSYQLKTSVALEPKP